MGTPKEYELYNAACAGQLDDVKRLVEEEGVNPNFGDGVVLYWAVFYGHADVVSYLLTKNVSTEYGSGVPGGDTPLSRAVTYNYVEIERLLLAAKADINAKNHGRSDGRQTYR